MTDDIVKYLRLSRTMFNRHAEAADEIERLRKDVKELQATISIIKRIQQTQTKIVQRLRQK
jgi:hypothetical protein